MMDPNENLEKQLRIAKRLYADGGNKVDAEKLAELVLNLDYWLHRAGAFPKRWATEVLIEPKEKR